MSAPPPRPDYHQRSLDLQARILPVTQIPEATPTQIFKALERHLIRAADDGSLASSIADIKQHLRLDKRRDGFTIYGARVGRANFDRSRDSPHFTRHDGAWFDFLISGRSSARNTVEILAYNCELRFPEALPVLPRFVRFDLNIPGHHNEEKGLRCHIHPGHDDIQAAAPFMQPLDILDFCLYGLKWPEKLRAS